MTVGARGATVVVSTWLQIPHTHTTAYSTFYLYQNTTEYPKGDTEWASNGKIEPNWWRQRGRNADDVREGSPNRTLCACSNIIFNTSYSARRNVDICVLRIACGLAASSCYHSKMSDIFFFPYSSISWYFCFGFFFVFFGIDGFWYTEEKNVERKA